MPGEVPAAVAAWPSSSWKKYYLHYLVESGCTFVYPRASLSTNFGARGTHFPHPRADFQVPLHAPLPRARSWTFAKRSEARCLYDPHFELIGTIVISIACIVFLAAMLIRAGTITIPAQTPRRPAIQVAQCVCLFALDG